MLIKLGFWTPVLFFLTLKSGFPETSSQLTPSSSEESVANLTSSEACRFGRSRIGDDRRNDQAFGRIGKR